MTSWQDESMAEYNRQRILKEVEQIRLEKVTRRPRSDGSSPFERIVLRLANWMISTGEQLRKQHKIPEEERWTHPRTKAIL